MRLHRLLLGANLALLVATSETTTQSVETAGSSSPACATVDLAQSFEVGADGALALVLSRDELGPVDGSLWLFAHPELTCRAEVWLGEGGLVMAANPYTDGATPEPTEASWIPAGGAWEVPVALDGGSELRIEVTACDGVVAELELAVGGCGEVQLAPVGR